MTRNDMMIVGKIFEHRKKLSIVLATDVPSGKKDTFSRHRQEENETARPISIDETVKRNPQ
jgi:hypothetical protein